MSSVGMIHASTMPRPQDIVAQGQTSDLINSLRVSACFNQKLRNFVVASAVIVADGTNQCCMAILPNTQRKKGTMWRQSKVRGIDENT